MPALYRRNHRRAATRSSRSLSMWPTQKSRCVDAVFRSCVAFRSRVGAPARVLGALGYRPGPPTRLFRRVGVRAGWRGLGFLMAALALSGASLAAHDMWIEPTAFTTDAGEIIAIPLR